MESIQVGHYNTLKVSRKVDFGFYLDDGADGILLPKRFDGSTTSRRSRTCSPGGIRTCPPPSSGRCCLPGLHHKPLLPLVVAEVLE